MSDLNRRAFLAGTAGLAAAAGLIGSTTAEAGELSFEWRDDEQGKTPVWVSRRDGDVFAFAGLWAALPARDGSGDLHSCAIVTCEPNELLRPIHDRMPVVLSPNHEVRWLEPDVAEDDLLSLLVPAPEELLAVREVVDAVNDVRKDGPHLLEPREAQPQLF